MSLRKLVGLAALYAATTGGIAGAQHEGLRTLPVPLDADTPRWNLTAASATIRKLRDATADWGDESFLLQATAASSADAAVVDVEPFHPEPRRNR